MRKPSVIQKTAVAAITGLAALLMPTQTGCTSFQPTRDEHNRIVGFHHEFDSEKTLSLIQLIGTGISAGYNLAAFANATNNLTRSTNMISYTTKLASLAKEHHTSPTVNVQFEGEPYGYRELGDRVNEAIENPRLFIEYLGLNTSGEMPEEVKRLQQFVGEWESECDAKVAGQKFKCKSTSQNKLISDGWLLTGEPPSDKPTQLGSNQIISRTVGLTGWSPRDRLYHTLQISKRYLDGLKQPIVSFSEITHKYDPATNTWTARAEKITGDNLYIVGTTQTRFEGDTVTSQGEFNFGTTTSIGTKIKD